MLFPNGELPTLTTIRHDPSKQAALTLLEQHCHHAVLARHLEVLRRTTGLGAQAREPANRVAKDLGVSRERVRAMTVQALKYLKDAATDRVSEDPAELSTAGMEGSSHTINLYQGDPMEQAVRLASLPPADLKREAAAAANTRDAVTGEVKRFSPATIQVKLSAARALYKALRWAGATKEAPFETVRVAQDPTPAWEKRGAYSPEEIERFLEQAEPADQVVVLLGAHAELRIAEMARLAWQDIDWRARELIVRKGKG